MAATDRDGVIGKVLIADDDRDLRELIAAALRRDGFEVVEAANGTQLIDMMVKHAIYADPEQKPADVIITDVRMPGCSGLQVLADMCGRRWAPPVVLMTAFGDAVTHKQAEQLGAVAVLDKPFDIADLRSLVGRMLEAEPVDLSP